MIYIYIYILVCILIHIYIYMLTNLGYIGKYYHDHSIQKKSVMAIFPAVHSLVCHSNSSCALAGRQDAWTLRGRKIPTDPDMSCGPCKP